MGGDDFGGGLWVLAIINSVIFIAFAASFVRPMGGRDWRAMGVFSGFVVALFTKMYGFPLTIFLLSGWLGSRFPQLLPTHAGGHLWNDLIGWTGDPHLSPFHLASYAGIIAGFWLIASAWQVLWAAQGAGRLATAGLYRRIRHPQYVGFVLVMAGLLLQWPTLLTLAMFPVVLLAYWRLALSEEREVRAQFGAEWDAYTAVTSRFVPRPVRRTGVPLDPDLGVR
jgi:protein-S-isoprenylcysteine O-methyltransferase Ste14